MTSARLIVDVASSDADVLSGRLWSLGTTGIEEQRGPFLVRLLAGFVDESAAEAARHSIGRGEVEPVTDDEYLDHWREFAQVTRAGRRFVLRPIWLDHRTVPNQVVIHLDPGRAFGTGSHPTTRLALAHIEEILEGDETVLDVGCGSGVLAIGAARIGATTVDALDTDPHARVVTVANAKRNGVEGLVHVVATPIEDLDGSYDLVMANISAMTIVELATDLTRLVAPRGRLLVSGLLTAQRDDVVSSFEQFDVRHSSSDDGWAALVFSRAP